MELKANVELKVLKPVHEVFEGIVDPKKMSNYFISSGSGRIEEGKKLKWYWAEFGGVELDVEVKNVELDKSITYLWSASGVQTTTQINLESIDPNITLVKIVEDGWSKDDQGITRLVQQTHGWVHFVCGLKVYLEHGINIRIGAF